MRLRNVASYGVVLATAAVLATQVDRFPDVFPVHWALDGQPNGFIGGRALALPLRSGEVSGRRSGGGGACAGLERIGDHCRLVASRPRFGS
jgi:hypothetical protein